MRKRIKKNKKKTKKAHVNKRNNIQEQKPVKDKSKSRVSVIRAKKKERKKRRHPGLYSQEITMD